MSSNVKASELRHLITELETSGHITTEAIRVRNVVRQLLNLPPTEGHPPALYLEMVRMAVVREHTKGPDHEDEEG